jgi:hypothetical protein
MVQLGEAGMTSEERKILEACADAMGLQYNPTVQYPNGLHVVNPASDCQSREYPWNPLVVVMDAADMAIQLKIDISWYGSLVASSRGAVGSNAKFSEYPTHASAYCWVVCDLVRKLKSMRQL